MSSKISDLTAATWDDLLDSDEMVFARADTSNYRVAKSELVSAVGGGGGGADQFWGSYTANGGYDGNQPTLYQGAAFDDPDATGIYHESFTHHGGPYSDYRFYGITDAQPFNTNEIELGSNSATVADGRTSFAYIQAKTIAPGGEYVWAVFNTILNPDGSERYGGFNAYADNTVGGNYAIEAGVLADDVSAVRLYPQTGQTAAIIQCFDLASSLGFSVGVDGGLGVFGKTPPTAPSAAGSTAADAIACLQAFGLMAT